MLRSSKRALSSSSSLVATTSGARRCLRRSLLMATCYSQRQRQFTAGVVAANNHHHRCASSEEQQQPSSSKIVDVSDLADQMRRNVREYTMEKDNKRVIRLAGILAVDAMPDPEDAELYASHIAERLQEDGMEYEHVRCRGTEPEDVEATIQEMNNREDVHGILVYYPIFKKRCEEELLQQQKKQQHGPYMNASTGVYYKTYDDYLRDVVSPEKDVEGLSSNYHSRWHFPARGRGGFPTRHFRKEGAIYIPCTALAVARIIETYHPPPTATTICNTNHNNNHNSSKPQHHQQLLDCTATVVNRSEIMGRPLAAMLALKGANVYSVDENSALLFKSSGKMQRCTEPHIDLDWCLAQSSIVVTGVPTPQFQFSAHSILAETATVINVSEFNNVDEESVLDRSGITYVPKVGKVTVSALEENLVRLHKLKVQKS